MKINFDLVESGERVEFNLKDTKVVNTGGGVSENRVREIVDEATAEVANAKSAVFVDGQKVDEFNADEKFDKTGGAIGGDVSIQGNLSVSGTTTTTDTQTLRVLDNVVVANANGIPLVELSGFAIKTNADQSYGIMYDTVGDGVKIGLGGFTEDGKFVYNEGEAQFLATRADAITDGHIPKWDNEKKQFVDSGVDHSEYVRFTDFDKEFKKSAIDNQEEWTDEEKAKACETIGAESKGYAKWKLIGETEITQEMIDEAGDEGITGVIIDLGKPVEKWFGETWVRLEMPTPNFNMNLPLYCKFGTTVEAAMSWDENNGCVIFSAQSESYGALFKNYPNTVNLFTNWNDNIPRGTAMQVTGFGAYNYPYHEYATSNNMSNPIMGNRYLATTTRHANGRGKLPAGTKLKLYGRFAE